MFDEARRLGLEQVLIVCAADNIASAKMIEYHGGVLEGIRDTELGPARRYWIKAPAHQPAFPGPSGKLHPVVDPRLRVVHAVRTSAASRAPPRCPTTEVRVLRARTSASCSL